MAYGMRASVLAGRRLHVYYSTEIDDELEGFPVVLAPLAHSYLDQLNPLLGKLTKETDRPKIAALMEHLQSGYAIGGTATAGYRGGVDDDNRPHGEGKMVRANGDEWTGTWAEGNMIRGKIFYATGNCYEGELDAESGLRSGLGRMVYFNGDEYCGGFVLDKRHGEGVLNWASGDSYKGTFAAGVRCGFGVFTKKRRKGARDMGCWVYTGSWDRDVEHGHGTLVSPDGKTVAGAWVHGMRVAAKTKTVSDAGGAACSDSEVPLEAIGGLATAGCGTDAPDCASIPCASPLSVFALGAQLGSDGSVRSDCPDDSRCPVEEQLEHLGLGEGGGVGKAKRK